MQKILASVFWKVASCGCFAGINVLVRYLTGGSPVPIDTPLPIYTIMFFQNVIGVILLSLYIKKDTFVGTTRPGLHAVRIITAALGIGVWYLSLRYIPVTQVVAISFIAPIITTMLAVIFLGESLDWKRALAIFLSILGGFLITRPDRTILGDIDYNWYMLLPLVAAFIFSLDKMLTRKLLLLQESPLSLALYLLTFIGPLCLLPCIYYGWVTPTSSHVPWLLLLGVLGAMAHYTFNRAYALADITFLLPFGAAKLLLCSMLSYTVFLEIPQQFDIWLGITILTLSTVILTTPISFSTKAQVVYK